MPHAAVIRRIFCIWDPGQLFNIFESPECRVNVISSFGDEFLLTFHRREKHAEKPMTMLNEAFYPVVERKKEEKKIWQSCILRLDCSKMLDMIVERLVTLLIKGSSELCAWVPFVAD